MSYYPEYSENRKLVEEAFQYGIPLQFNTKNGSYWEELRPDAQLKWDTYNYRISSNKNIVRYKLESLSDASAIKLLSDICKRSLSENKRIDDRLIYSMSNPEEF